MFDAGLTDRVIVSLLLVGDKEMSVGDQYTRGSPRETDQVGTIENSGDGFFVFDTRGEIMMEVMPHAVIAVRWA